MIIKWISERFLSRLKSILCWDKYNTITILLMKLSGEFYSWSSCVSSPQTLPPLHLSLRCTLQTWWLHWPNGWRMWAQLTLWEKYSQNPVQKLCMNFWNWFFYILHKIPFYVGYLWAKTEQCWTLRSDLLVIENIFELSHLSEVILNCASSILWLWPSLSTSQIIIAFCWEKARKIQQALTSFS